MESNRSHPLFLRPRRFLSAGLALALTGVGATWGRSGHADQVYRADPSATATAVPAAPVAVPAPTPSSTGGGTQSGALQFTKYVLSNGMEVILHEDHRLPRVAVNLWYHVGPAREVPGRSGFAHLFEHLMFAGSAHVGNQADQLLEAAGATNANGTTSWDRTNYFETVPREYLNLALWIESDRMGFLSLTDERLGIQRDVVQNERRQSYENTPYGPSELALYEHLFPASHPYHGAVIGSLKDIAGATLKDAKDFYQTYYSPGNATLVLAGDIDVAATRKAIDLYFGTLPPRPLAPRIPGVVASLSGSERVVVKEPVKLPRVTLAWLTPPAYGPDHAPLEIALSILAGGKSTRLYRKLVVQERSASDVGAAQDSAELGSIVTVSATGTQGRAPVELERSLDGVLAELGAQGPTPAELDRARRGLRVALEEELQTLNGPGGESGRAGLLQRFNHYLKDPGYLPHWVKALEGTTAQDVRRVVAKYLSPQHRVVVVTEPTVPATGGPAEGVATKAQGESAKP